MRPKVGELSWDYKELKARPLALCDSVLNLVCSAVSQPLTAAFNRCAHSELFIGKSLSQVDIE